MQVGGLFKEIAKEYFPHMATKMDLYLDSSAEFVFGVFLHSLQSCKPYTGYLLEGFLKNSPRFALNCLNQTISVSLAEFQKQVGDWFMNAVLYSCVLIRMVVGVAIDKLCQLHIIHQRQR